MIVTTDNYGTVIFQNLTAEDQIVVAQYVGGEFDFIGVGDYLFERLMRIANIVRMSVILQKSIPFDASSEKPLPGILPLDPDQWLMIDDAYAAQMALRQELITTKRDRVIGIDPAALPAARELLGQVVDYFTRTGAMQHVDGVCANP